MQARSSSFVVRVAIALLIASFLLANLLRALQLDLDDSNASISWQPTTTVKRVSLALPLLLLNNRTSRLKRRILLIHVGKTGGETVRHTLKVTCRMRKNEVHQQSCWDSFSNTTETALSKHTFGTMHCNVVLPKKGLERATTMLWTLRNPVTRVVSWFRYMNPANCLPFDDYYSTACNTNRSIRNNHKHKKGSQWSFKFFMCFPTINHFANALVLPSSPSFEQETNNNTNNNCSQLAWKTIRGESSPSSSHIYFNHRYYWQETVANYPNMEIWVARTEYLWDDLDRIETILPGGKRTTTNVPPHSKKRNVTHGSEGHVQKESLSAKSQMRLCCALKEEITIYGNLLERATNLEDSAKNQSLWMVAQQCGASNWDEFNHSVCSY